MELTFIPKRLADQINQHVNLTELPTYEQLRQMQVDEYNASQGELTGYCCALCNNKGFIQRLENGNIINQQCECIIKHRAIKKLENSGLAVLLKEYTFANFQTQLDWQSKTKKKAIDFVKAQNAWFFIGGQSGSGKTHICTAICGQFLKHNKAVRYMIWTMEIRTLKASANDVSAYKKLFDDYAKADILYIDDLFKVKSDASITSADIQHTYDIINYRYNNNLCTIFSCEQNISEILKIDKATGGRIYQRSKGFIVELGKDDDKNWRLK